MSRKEEKIHGLLGQFFTGDPKGSFARYSDLAKQLMAYGADAVDPILEKLFQREADGEPMLFLPGVSTFHLLKVVERFAERRHAEQVARMLSWEEVVQGQDRTYRTMIPRILERIGDSSVVPALEAFAERVGAIEYEDYHDPLDHAFIPASDYNQWDQEEITAAIVACKQRDSSPSRV
jgi:hypothetical protein